MNASPANWSVRGATFALWLLAAATAAYWALQLGTAPRRTAPLAQTGHGFAAADPVAIARLLGASTGPVQGPALPSLSSRFALVGVVAEAHSGGGAALISIDGRPARPFRVGSTVEEGLVLQAVRGRSAELGATRDGPPVLTLELPRLKSA